MYIVLCAFEKLDLNKGISVVTGWMGDCLSIIANLIRVFAMWLDTIIFCSPPYLSNTHTINNPPPTDTHTHAAIQPETGVCSIDPSQ